MPTVSSHRPGQLTVRKVYGHDRFRLMRCRTCGEEFSERRGTPCSTRRSRRNKRRPSSTIWVKDAGCVPPPAWSHVAKDTVARCSGWLDATPSGCMTQRVRDVTPRALEFDEQWRFVKKSRSGVGQRSAPRLGICGIIRRSRPIANWWCRSSSANGPRNRRRPWCNDAKSRLRPGHLPAMFTDAYAGYESALLEAFGRRYPAPRHGAKGRAAPSCGPLATRLGVWASAETSTRGSRIERVEVRAVYDKARLKHVLVSPRLQRHINTECGGAA